MNDLLSIIIPAYNLENYIEKTIHNVLAQSYSPFEVIVVNDGSKDRTGEILNRIAAEHPEHLRVLHIPNGGVTNARLTGVRAAKGDWIGFVDGDDFIEPEMYSLMLSNAKKYNATISHCGYDMVFPSRRLEHHNTKQLLVRNQSEALCDLLSGSLIEPSLSNKLFRADLFVDFLSNGQMDCSIKINEDLLMNFYLFQQAECSVFEDVCLYHYMVRASSAANSAINEHRLLDPCRVRKIIMEKCKELPAVYPLACENYARQLITLATYSAKEAPELIRPHRKQAKKQLRGFLKQKPPLGRSVRLMARWAACFPASYRFVHSAYGKLKGYDKLYEIK